MVLADGLDAVPESWTTVVDRARMKHPRNGTPARRAADIRPEGGGEFFHSRGIGRDTTPCCFVPGCEGRPRPNIAAFVQCKEAGERVVAMFGGRARLDFRESEPDRVQVKVGACDAHRGALERLHEATRGGVISAAIINRCGGEQ